MTDDGAQAAIELGRRPEKPRRDDALGNSPLGRRVLSPRNILSVLLTLGVLYLVYRQVLGLD